MARESSLESESAFERIVAGGCLLLVFALCGCRRSFYAAKGTVESHGGPLGQWSLPPQGCSLAPFDGLAVGASYSVVEFVWEHGRPSLWRPEGPEDRWAQGPETLDISRAANGIQTVDRTGADNATSAGNGAEIDNYGAGINNRTGAGNAITASLKLVQTGPALALNAETCRELRLDSHPGPPVVPGAPASLAGRLVLDCTVNGSHLTGDLEFRGCVL